MLLGYRANDHKKVSSTSLMSLDEIATLKVDTFGRITTQVMDPQESVRLSQRRYSDFLP